MKKINIKIIKVFFAVAALFFYGCSEIKYVTVEYLPNRPSQSAVIFGKMNPETVEEGIQITIKPNAYYSNDYVFQGWSEAPTGDVVYFDRAKVRVPFYGLKLYAVWKAKEEVGDLLVFRESMLTTSSVQIVVSAVGRDEPIFVTAAASGVSELETNGNIISAGGLSENTSYTFKILAFTPSGELFAQADYTVLTLSAAEEKKTGALTDVSFNFPSGGQVEQAFSGSEIPVSFILSPSDAVVTGLTVSDGAVFLPDSLNDVTSGVLRLPETNMSVSGKEFVFTFTTVGDKKIEKILTVNNFDEKTNIPGSVVRDGENYDLIKGFDFNEVFENGGIFSGAHDNSDEISFTVTVDETYDDRNGALTVQTVNTRKSGNRVYPLIVGQKADYAEIKVKVKTLSPACVGVGLGTSETENDFRGWKNQFLWGEEGEQWRVRAYSDGNDGKEIQSLMEADKWFTVGIEFSTLTKKYFFNGTNIWESEKGIDFTTAGDGETYYLYIAHDKNGINTVRIDSVAFYKKSVDEAAVENKQ